MPERSFRLYLPSGLRVRIACTELGSHGLPKHRAGIFAPAMNLFEAGGAITDKQGEPVPVDQLQLRDFHALRGVATRLGWLEEEPLEIRCGNCGRKFEHLACAALELGPFADGELRDPDLDRCLDLEVEHPIPALEIPGGARVDRIRFSDLTLGEALPLHRALARATRYKITAGFVRGMGIEALGEERDPGRIALALERCSEPAWQVVTELFLAAHYPPRLFSVAACPGCGARHDVDAPLDREFSPDAETFRAVAGESAENSEPLPEFDKFAEVAGECAERILGSCFDQLTFVVEDGPAACDEGGETLFGCYDPPMGGDGGVPPNPPRITVFYRTFAAIQEEEGEFDWRGELEITIEHELEHHIAALLWV